MKKYYVKNGKIIINKYSVCYSYNTDNGNSETKSEVIQYCRNDNEFNALVTELEQKDIEYTISALDVSDILMFDGLPVSNNEEARKLIEPAIDEVKADKLKEISDICEQTIYKGIDVTLSEGNTKHFSLKTEDQINLNGLLGQINLGNIKPENGVPYHADGEMCSLFSIADFTLIANNAMAFILQQTTYCNHLMSYVKSLENINDVRTVVYGQVLTGEFLESYNLIIGGDVVE